MFEMVILLKAVACIKDIKLILRWCNERKIPRRVETRNERSVIVLSC